MLQVTITASMAEMISLLVAILALIVVTLTLWPILADYLRRNHDKKVLERNKGSGPYDSATIERSIKYYIRPKCSNIDPAQESEIRHALVATREDLFSKVDYFLDNKEDKRHLLILADSGTGKTSFVLNYFVYHLKRPKNLRKSIFLVPLGQKNVDQSIRSIENQSGTVIFLDALDEDTKAIENHHQRLRELMDLCSNFDRVVITCRTQFFPKDEEIPIETGVIKLGPRAAGDKGIYEFWKLYLSPFDDVEIKNYFKKRFPFWQIRQREKAIRISETIPLLSARPMLLAHIPDILNEEFQITTVTHLYEIMVNAWLERESRWVGTNELKQFSRHFAKEIYLNRVKRGYEGAPIEELADLAQKWKIDLKSWQLSGRSLLNRDATGIYKFSHRSIMEYFYVLNILNGDNKSIGQPMTDLMTQFLLDSMKIEDIYKQELQKLLSSKMIIGVITNLDNKMLTIFRRVPINVSIRKTVIKAKSSFSSLILPNIDKPFIIKDYESNDTNIYINEQLTGIFYLINPDNENEVVLYVDNDFIIKS